MFGLGLVLLLALDGGVDGGTAKPRPAITVEDEELIGNLELLLELKKLNDLDLLLEL